MGKRHTSGCATATTTATSTTPTTAARHSKRIGLFRQRPCCLGYLSVLQHGECSDTNCSQTRHLDFGSGCVNSHCILAPLLGATGPAHVQNGAALLHLMWYSSGEGPGVSGFLRARDERVAPSGWRRTGPFESRDLDRLLECSIALGEVLDKLR